VAVFGSGDEEAGGGGGGWEYSLESFLGSLVVLTADHAGDILYDTLRDVPF